MEVTIAEARPLDLLEALDDHGGGRAVRTRTSFGRFARQVEGGAAVTVRTVAGELVAVAGLYPDDPNGAEGWFAAGPALRGSLLATVRLLRRTLDLAGAEASPLLVSVYLHPRGVAGARLARWLGFQAVGITDTAIGRLATFRRRFA